MGKRHNTLSDDIFKNSKYIATIEKELRISNFKKYAIDQYEIMLDIFQTLIAINNLFFADSNKNKKEKKNEIIDILEKVIYKSQDDDRAKYSTRTIKSLYDGTARFLYNKYNEWYEKLSYNDNYFDTLKIEIEEEMKKFENVGFNYIVKGTIEYEKNKDSNYKIFISKFNNLYIDYKAFKRQYKDNFNNNYGIDLTKEEMRYIGFIYDLVAYANNGIVKTLFDKEPLNFQLDETSAPEEYYKEYLKLLHLDIKDNELYTKNSEIFLSKILVVNKRLIEHLPKEIVYNISINDFINRFDYYYFIVSMKDIIDNNIKVFFDNMLINKITNDLKEIYNLISIQYETKEKMLINYKDAFRKCQAIIDRNKNIYERLS